MATVSFPNCCTAKVTYNFNEFSTEKALKDTLVYDIDWARRDGNAVLLASTTVTQKRANKVLKELGFKKTKGFKKARHPETGKLYIWFLPLQE